MARRTCKLCGARVQDQFANICNACMDDREAKKYKYKSNIEASWTRNFK